MKKIIPALLIICVLFLFAGCNESSYDDVPYEKSNMKTEEFLIIYQDAYNKTRDINNFNLNITYESNVRTENNYQKNLDNIKISTYQGKPILVINNSNEEIIYYLDKKMYNDVVDSKAFNTTEVCNNYKTNNMPTLDSSIIVNSIQTKKFEDVTFYKLNYDIDYINNQKNITDVLIKNSEDAYPDFIYSYSQEFGINSSGYIVMARTTYELQQRENRNVYFWAQQTTDLIDYSNNMQILDDMTKLNKIINT